MSNIRFKLWLLVSYCLLLSVPSFANGENVPLKGAACLVSDEKGRILIAKDILNNRFAIPGGYIDNDNPADAAVRETLEETGIHVVAIRELAKSGSGVIFDCQATSPIEVYESSDGSATVPAWEAKHFGREIRTALMQHAEDMNLSEARYPEQVTLFPHLLSKATVSNIITTSDFSDKTSSFNRWNAQWNRVFQHTVAGLPEFAGQFLTFSSALGNGALFFMLIPFAMATGGVRRTSQLFFVTIAIAVIVGYVKLLFAVPRPFYLYPELQIGHASGFAFPSGHTATAFAAWGMIYHWCKKAGYSNLILWWLPALLVALSRVYLGVHYVTDVIAGSVIGTLVVAVAQSEGVKKHLLIPSNWLGISVIAFALSWSQHLPVFLYCAVFAFSFSIALIISKSTSSALSAPYGKHGFIYTFIGLIATAAAMGAVARWSVSSIEILVANALSFGVLALWLVLAVPMLTNSK